VYVDRFVAGFQSSEFRPKQLVGVFPMKYRGIDYAVAQEIDRDTWIWTVHIDNDTAESGQRKTRESALTAIVMTIDRWATQRQVASESVRDTAHDVVG
jgi:hypothetical protein